MHETLKNVSLFGVFLIAIIFLERLTGQVKPYFDFHRGESVAIMASSTLVVIIFYFLYGFIGKKDPKVSYVILAASSIVLWLLTHFEKFKLK